VPFLKTLDISLLQQNWEYEIMENEVNPFPCSSATTNQEERRMIGSCRSI
jgi:hypothetical protein